MKIYYAVGVVGLLDLRGVHGGYNVKKYAVEHAKRILEEEGHAASGSMDRKTKVGDWFSVHPFGGFVDGPYPKKADAERERKRVCTEYAQDANYDKGFVAKAVYVKKSVAVVERDYDEDTE